MDFSSLHWPDSLNSGKNNQRETTETPEEHEILNEIKFGFKK